jgi:hypothetical protein
MSRRFELRSLFLLGCAAPPGLSVAMRKSSQERCSGLQRRGNSVLIDPCEVTPAGPVHTAVAVRRLGVRTAISHERTKPRRDLSHRRLDPA